MSDARSIVQLHAENVDAIKELVKGGPQPQSKDAVHAQSMLVESSFLLMTCFTETAIDDLFWNSLVVEGFLGPTYNVVQRFNSTAIARQIVSSQGYMDWLPYSRVSERCGKFFVDDNPFCQVDGSMVDVLARCAAIRNFIAHRSEESINKLVQIPPVLRPRDYQDTIALYLLSTHKVGQSQFDLCAQAYKEWVNSICIHA